jgi:hypothetical protein
MKDSCIGLDHRVFCKFSLLCPLRLTILISFSSWKFKEYLTCLLYAETANKQTDTMYMGIHAAAIYEGPNPPYQWVQRLTGKSATGHYIACAVDTIERTWSLYYLIRDGEDIRQQAVNRNMIMGDPKPAPATTPAMTHALVRNGTFSMTHAKNEHLLIPELNLAIANHWDFNDKYAQQLFLRVFNTSGLSGDAAMALLDTIWSSRGDSDKIIMRTASFGYGRKRLDMCIRESKPEIPAYIKQRGELGIAEVMYVPLAIIQAFRMQQTFNEEKASVPDNTPRKEAKKLKLEELLKAKSDADSMPWCDKTETNYDRLAEEFLDEQ